MIRIVEGVDRGRYPELMDKMFRMRAEVFSGRLGWEVNVVVGEEPLRGGKSSRIRAGGESWVPEEDPEVEGIGVSSTRAPA